MGILITGYGYGDGYGYGNGDGAGYGYGAGYGTGYGSGAGYGDGSGAGYGDGIGSGAGYGDGTGYGSGAGYGDGNGYGYGSGDGSGSGADTGYGQVFLPQDRKLPKGAIVAFWKSDRDGKPCNGGSGSAVKPGLVQTEPAPLTSCQRGALHATRNPQKWKGDRLWLVVMHAPWIEVNRDKIAGLKREIVMEIKQPNS